MEKETYTLDQIVEANLLVRSEYESILKQQSETISKLESTISDLLYRMQNLENVKLYNSEQRTNTEAPSGFKDLTEEQDNMLIGVLRDYREHLSDWEVSFISSIREQQSTSQKQRDLLNKTLRKVWAKAGV